MKRYSCGWNERNKNKDDKRWTSSPTNIFFFLPSGTMDSNT